ncbi:MAG: hypothetical protein D4R79_14170, partial [Comamonadaceae bacterium]
MSPSIHRFIGLSNALFRRFESRDVGCADVVERHIVAKVVGCTDPRARRVAADRDWQATDIGGTAAIQMAATAATKIGHGFDGLLRPGG